MCSGRRVRHDNVCVQRYVPVDGGELGAVGRALGCVIVECPKPVTRREGGAEDGKLGSRARRRFEADVGRLIVEVCDGWGGG